MTDQMEQQLENGAAKGEHFSPVKQPEIKHLGEQEQKIIDRIERGGDENKVLQDIAVNDGTGEPKNTQKDDDSRKPFDVSGIEHRRIEKFRPEFIARGGENLVYSLPDYPDYVAKVDMPSLIKSVDKNIREGKFINKPLTGNEKQRVEKDIQAENERFELLKKYFGEEHVLKQSKHRFKVPLSRDLVNQIYEARHQQVPDGIDSLWANEAWATVTLQQKAPEIGMPTQYGIVAGYVESDPREKPANYKDVYSQVTESLVLYPEGQQDVPEDQLLAIHGGLYPLLQEIKANPQAREILSDFVQKAITYTQETGRILDLGSLENVTFYKMDSGNWNYRLVDPVHSFQVGDQVSKVREVVTKIENGQAQAIDYLTLLGPLNYTRTVNGLAQQLKIPSYIKMIPEGANVNPSQIYDGIKEALSKENEILKQMMEAREMEGKMISLDEAQKGMLEIGDPAIERVYKAMEGKDLPMIFRFKTPNEHSVYYAGTIHPHNLSPEQRQTQTDGLKTAFNEFNEATASSQKRIVFIEGGKPGILTNEYSSFEEASQRGGEMGEITWFAKEAGIDVMSPDIPHEETVRFMKEQGVPDLTIALNFAFRNVHSVLLEKAQRHETSFAQQEVADMLLGLSLVYTDWERDFAQQQLAEIKKLGVFDTSEGRARIQDYINTMLPKLNNHLKENSKFIKNEETGEEGIQLLVQKGVDESGNPIYVSEYDPEKHYQPLANPFVNNPDNPKGILNYLSAKLSDNRDRYILGQLVNKVNEGYNVFIGFGNSHAIQEGAGLIAAGCSSEDYPKQAISGQTSTIS